MSIRGDDLGRSCFIQDLLFPVLADRAKSNKPRAPINHALTAPPPPLLLVGTVTGAGTGAGAGFTVRVAAELVAVPYGLLASADWRCDRAGRQYVSG